MGVYNGSGKIECSHCCRVGVSGEGPGLWCSYCDSSRRDYFMDVIIETRHIGESISNCQCLNNDQANGDHSDFCLLSYYLYNGKLLLFFAALPPNQHPGSGCGFWNNPWNQMMPNPQHYTTLSPLIAHRLQCGYNTEYSVQYLLFHVLCN